MPAVFGEGGESGRGIVAFAHAAYLADEGVVVRAHYCGCVFVGLEHLVKVGGMPFAESLIVWGERL